MPSRPRPPLPLTAARVVAGVQVLAALVLAGVGGVGAVAAGRDPQPWNGLAVAIGGAVAVAGFTIAVLLGVSLLVLRSGSPTRRITGRGLLVGVEILLLVPLAVGLASGTRMVSTSAAAVVLVAVMTVPAVVIGCLLAPSARRWVKAA